MEHLITNSIFFLAFLSPPFLGFFAWKNFLKPFDAPGQITWKAYVEWFAIIGTSLFFLVCLVGAFVIPQDVTKDNWASVAKWRSFTGAVIRIAPALLFLAVCGRKGTRLLSSFWIVAVVIDCIAVDMMA